MTRHRNVHVPGIRRGTPADKTKKALDDHERQHPNRRDSQPATNVSALVTALTVSRHPILEMAAEHGLTLTIYAAEPGSPSEDALRPLASWAASQEADASPQQLSTE